MQSIQHWALSICLSCVAAGILQCFSISHSHFSVIKLILTLYILITSFSPLHQDLSFDTVSYATLPGRSIESIDLYDETLNEAKRNLEKTIAAELAKHHITGIKVNVKLEKDMQNIVRTDIILKPGRTRDLNMAIQIIRDFLGEDINLCIVDEDLQDET